ncbi:MAG: EamA family transporter [Bacteroidetes bacterium]|nr:MAG: EamA family transporter [Bacteroidota bacterium]MBL1143821.1 EamA family transporter [Bacteroidota bacterium]NOG56622.1 EamA family transporter [Bacteroidota bacterium]
MKNILLQNKSLWLLQLVVLIFGFTAILGKLISLDSQALVWYRMFFAFLSLIAYALIKGKKLQMPLQGFVWSILTGVVVAAHWIFFFEAIKQSNVSVTLAALSSASIFTAFLEPLFFKRRILPYEILLGLIVISGLYFIYQINEANEIGIILGLISAFLASLFTVINGKLIKKFDSTRISIYELLGGTIAISIYLFFKDKLSLINFEMDTLDLFYLLILAIICTAFAFVASVEVMKELSPFTVSLSINLEPVYGIILAFLIFGEEEKMSFGFYIGTVLILLGIFLNIWIKHRQKKKLKLMQ